MIGSISKKRLGEVGVFGEDAAEKRLIELGYKIVGRNVVVGKYEIDIIAEDLRHIVFVEVKTRTIPKSYGRSRYGPPSSAINYEKKRHIVTAATAYLKLRRYRKLPRIDVIEVYLNKLDDGYSVNKINHYPNAFGVVR